MFIEEIEEISAPDDDENTEFDQATVDGRIAAYQKAYDQNISGGMLATWGTGYQGGLQLSYQTPSQK